MNGDMPTISVIIPTHNRSTSLHRTLDALCRQSYPLQQVEVLVIADGCTDGTVNMLQSYQAPFALCVIEQSGQGQSVARNLGATQARGRLLIFIDDDVEPMPSLLEGHVNAHKHQAGQVIVAPYPPLFPEASFLQLELQGWWESKFQVTCQPGHRFTYQDLLSGNFSIDAGLFANIGGFDPDPDFRAHEDYELGIRLIRAGALFSCAPDAGACHHDASDLNRTCLRKLQEGRADVLLARRYPEISQTLPFVRHEISTTQPYTIRILRNAAFGSRAIGDRLATTLQKRLHGLERVRLRYQWRHLFGILQEYWYWRGVAEATCTRQSLSDLVEESKAYLSMNTSKIELDLREGLETVEQRLDEERPMGARIRYGRRPIGLVPAQAGAEPLRGIHLRPILATTLAVPLLEALVLEGVIPTSKTAERLKLAEHIRSLSHWFEPVEQGKMWFEQYGQWRRLEKEESEAERRLREYWNRVIELDRETAWLEEERACWQRLAEEREQIINQQLVAKQEGCLS